MSNRTLIEINHDLWFRIRANTTGFAMVVCDYLRCSDSRSAEALQDFGIRVFGMRHHSDSFSIDWGGIRAREMESQKR